MRVRQVDQYTFYIATPMAALISMLPRPRGNNDSLLIKPLLSGADPSVVMQKVSLESKKYQQNMYVQHI